MNDGFVHFPMSICDRKREYKARLMRDRTATEILLHRHLQLAGIRHIEQHPIRVNQSGLRFVDFYLLKYQMIIEVDGVYHNAPEQKKKDEKRFDQLRRVRPGWKILVITDKEIKKDIKKVIERITAEIPQAATV
jgi:5-methyltetrahydrofolate--homocysteine methyltransferase